MAGKVAGYGNRAIGMYRSVKIALVAVHPGGICKVWCLGAKEQRRSGAANAQLHRTGRTERTGAPDDIIQTTANRTNEQESASHVDFWCA
jgi:hypothetical protein